MHDFCFTIPYGFLVLVGGIVGYLRRGSTASLAGGAGSGLVLLLAGFISLKAFEKRRNSYFALGLETVCSLTLTYIMGKRYLETSKIMPAGLVATLRLGDLSGLISPSSNSGLAANSGCSKLSLPVHWWLLVFLAIVCALLLALALV